MMTQDAKRAWSVNRSSGDVRRRQTFDKIGAECLVLALRGGGSSRKKAGLGS